MAAQPDIADVDRPLEPRLGALVWLPIGLVALLSGLAFLYSGFRIRPQWEMPSKVFLCLPIVYVLLPHSLRLFFRIGLNAVLQNALIAASGLMLVYASATLGRPLVDDKLLWLDQLLGYDWAAYARFFASHERLAAIVLQNYLYIFLIPFLVIGGLTVTGRIQRLEKFLLVSLATLLITTGIFALFPATTAWVHLGLSDVEINSYRYLLLASEDWLGDLLDIRSGGGRIRDGFPMYGLVAFPSYHCIAAILFVWASWTVHGLRPFMVAVNLLMLAATPIVGGHYLVDLVAGALIVPPTIILVEWLYSKALKMNAREGKRSLVPTMAFDFSRISGKLPIALRDGRAEQPPRIGM
jgi:hypothetical protein